MVSENFAQKADQVPREWKSMEVQSWFNYSLLTILNILFNLRTTMSTNSWKQCMHSSCLFTAYVENDVYFYQRNTNPILFLFRMNSYQHLRYYYSDEKINTWVVTKKNKNIYTRISYTLVAEISSNEFPSPINVCWSTHPGSFKKLSNHTVHTHQELTPFSDDREGIVHWIPEAFVLSQEIKVLWVCKHLSEEWTFKLEISWLRIEISEFAVLRASKAIQNNHWYRMCMLCHLKWKSKYIYVQKPTYVYVYLLF